MSHFFVMVLAPRNIKHEIRNYEKYLEEILAPYNENKRMPKYETPCHCVGEEVRREARELADREFGPIDQLRTKFHEEHREKTDRLESLMKKMYGDCPEAELEQVQKDHAQLEKETDKLWKTFLKPRINFEKREVEKHPKRSEPTKTCGFYTEDFLKSLRERYPDEKRYFKLKPGDRFDDKSGCAGTGVVTSIYNPKSKWDFYQIGGRYTGRLMDGYNPEKDPENWEMCFLCHGTGLRDDEMGVKEREKDPNYKCNGCVKGKALKHASQWKKFSGDVLPLMTVKPNVIPFAIVTPDGQWHEKGKMGWWAMVSDEDDDWDKKAKEILDKHRENTVAIAVDCHI